MIMVTICPIPLVDTVSQKPILYSFSLINISRDIGWYKMMLMEYSALAWERHEELNGILTQKQLVECREWLPVIMPPICIGQDVCSNYLYQRGWTLWFAMGSIPFLDINCFFSVFGSVMLNVNYNPYIIVPYYNIQYFNLTVTTVIVYYKTFKYCG